MTPEGKERTNISDIIVFQNFPAHRFHPPVETRCSGSVWLWYKCRKFWRKSQIHRGIWSPLSIIHTVSDRVANHLSSESFASSTPVCLFMAHHLCFFIILSHFFCQFDGIWKCFVRREMKALLLKATRHFITRRQSCFCLTAFWHNKTMRNVQHGTFFDTGNLGYAVYRLCIMS